jgi:hypothetical protein
MKNRHLARGHLLVLAVRSSNKTSVRVLTGSCSRDLSGRQSVPRGLNDAQVMHTLCKGHVAIPTLSHETDICILRVSTPFQLHAYSLSFLLL